MIHRIQGTVGRNVRLMQNVWPTSITIAHNKRTAVVVNRTPTRVGTSGLCFYDFTPKVPGDYLVIWNDAPENRRWEIVEVSCDYIHDLLRQVMRKLDEIPSAKTG